MAIMFLINYYQNFKSVTSTIMNNSNNANNELMAELEALRTEVVALRKQNKEKQEQQIVTKIALLIRQCLNLDDILQTTVTEIRNLLQCDRVIIYQLRENKNLGFVAKESVSDRAFSIIKLTVTDSCFEQSWMDSCHQGRVRVIDDIETESEMVDCYKEFLQNLQIRANLVLPIIYDHHFWGLLIAQHCTAPRHWTNRDVKFMQELAIQVGIAVQQAELVAQLQRESTRKQQVEIILQQLNQDLKKRIARKTTKLIKINQRLEQELRDRQETEKALHNREALLRSIGDNLPNGFIFQFVKEANGNYYFSYLSAGIERETGFTVEQVLEDITLWQNLILEEDLQFIMFKTQESWENLSLFDIELRRRRSETSDEIRWMRICSTPRRLDNGNTIWDGIHIDITDLKRTEEKLRENQALLIQAQKIAHIGNWSYDLATGKITWTEGLFKILHRDIALGATNYLENLELYLPEDQIILDQVVQQAIKTGEPYKISVRHPCPDGSLRYIEAIGQAEFNTQGEVIRVYGTAQDITERKQTQIALEEFNRRWRSLLDNVELIVVQLNDQGIVDYINPFFEKLTQFTSEEVMGKHWFTNFIPSYLQNSMKLEFEKTLPEGLYTHYQNPIITKSGEERIIAWNNTVLRDNSGQITGSMSIGEDITERYHLERVKSEFISIVSHELRTPLTAIQAALSLLAEKIIDPHTPAGEKAIKIATEGADRLVRLINDILDLERLESGKMRLEKVFCNTADLIDTATEEMQEVANQAGVIFDVKSKSFQLEADPDRLVQVLINLLGNAIKFSPSNGTVWLTLELINQENAFFVLFTVRDQGRGIPAKNLDLIFERFHQVDASDSREKGGTGLGLPISRNIVEQHGGKIWVETVLKKGSTFYFTIPIMEKYIKEYMEECNVN
jgi:PAS domain S-box-containing protein